MSDLDKLLAEAERMAEQADGYWNSGKLTMRSLIAIVKRQREPRLCDCKSLPFQCNACAVVETDCDRIARGES